MNENYHDGTRKPLLRSVDDRMIAGVASGLAAYFDIDPTVVRLALVVMTLLGGFTIPLYAAAWLLIPEQGAPASVAESFLGRPAGRAQ